MGKGYKMSLKYSTKDEIFEEIKNIVIEQRGSYNSELTRDIQIVGDLGCTGLDADDLMETFFHKFGVNRGDFEFLKYFAPESIDILRIEYIKRKFTRTK